MIWGAHPIFGNTHINSRTRCWIFFRKKLTQPPTWTSKKPKQMGQVGNSSDVWGAQRSRWHELMHPGWFSFRDLQKLGGHERSPSYNWVKDVIPLWTANSHFPQLVTAQVPDFSSNQKRSWFIDSLIHGSFMVTCKLFTGTMGRTE